MIVPSDRVRRWMRSNFFESVNLVRLSIALLSVFLMGQSAEQIAEYADRLETAFVSESQFEIIPSDSTVPADVLRRPPPGTKLLFAARSPNLVALVFSYPMSAVGPYAILNVGRIGDDVACSYGLGIEPTLDLGSLQALFSSPEDAPSCNYRVAYGQSSEDLADRDEFDD